MSHGLKRMVASVVLFSSLFAAPLHVLAFDPAPSSTPTAGTPSGADIPGLPTPDASSTPQAPLSKDFPTNIPDIKPGDHSDTPSDAEKTPVSSSAPSSYSTDPTVGINPAVLFSSQKDSNGALSYSYPIVTPPGRKDLLPPLSLNYNSLSQNNDSLVGYGWEMNIASIERVNRSGTDTLFTQNTFSSSLSGELVAAGGTSYLPQSQKGDFLLYAYSGDVWTATDKAGTVYTFGASTDSRQDNLSSSTIFRWMISEIRDKNNNVVTYSYTKDGGQIYPASIVYTGSGSTAGVLAVRFTLASASHPVVSESSGFPVTSSYLISTVTTSVSGSTVRSYALAYTTGHNANRALLQSVTESATDASGTVTTFPSTTFGYQASTDSWNLSSTWTMPTYTSGADTYGYTLTPGYGSTMMDVNGDGLPDFVATRNYTTPTVGYGYGVYLNTGSGWSTLSSWTMPTYTSGADTLGYTLDENSINRLLDVNGDGLPDFVVTQDGTLAGTGSPATDTGYRVFLNTGSGWSLSSTWTMPTYTSGSLTYGHRFGQNYGNEVVDVNGDGLPDVVISEAYVGSSFSATTGYRVYLNTGSGWSLSSTWTMPTYTVDTTEIGYCFYSSQNQLIDINGDGLLDVVITQNGASVVTGNPTTDTGYRVFLNTGAGWSLSSTWAMPTYTSGSSTYGYSFYYAQNQFSDVNGDGLPDVVITQNGASIVTGTPSTDTGYRVFLNTGSSWTLDTSWIMPTYTASSNTYGYSLIEAYNQVIDVSGDGLVDFVVTVNPGSPNGAQYITGVSSTDTGYRVFLNTGSGWALDTSWVMPPYITYTSGILGYALSNSGNEVKDINNDGLPDFITTQGGTSIVTGSPATDVSYRVFLGTGAVSDHLSSVTHSSGASMAISYGQTPIIDRNPFRETQVLLTVSRVDVADGLGNTSTTTYAYADGKYYFHPEGYKTFAGFGSMTATDALSNTIKTYFHQGNSSDSSSSEPTDSESRLGLPYRVDRRNSSGTLTQTTTTRWSETSLATDAYVVAPTAEATMTYNTDGSTHSDTVIAHTYTQPNASVAPYFYAETVKSEYGTVTASSDGSYTDTGADTRVTTTTYAADTTGVVNGLPSQVTLTNSSGTTIAQSKYSYDSLSYGSVSTGNATTEQQWISGSTYASTTHTYDAYGNVLMTIAPNGGVTTTVYETTGNQYPSTVTDASSHQTTFVYSLLVGKPTSVTNPNGSIVTTVYDGLSRPTSETQSSDASATTMVTTKTWSYNDSSLPRSITAREYLSATVYKETITFIDGFGRTVEVKMLAASGSGYNESQTTYDALGRVSSTTLPQATALSTYESTAVSSSLAQTFGYDTLSRITSVVDVFGTTSTSYSGLTKTVTDALSKQKSYTTDGLGRLTSVVENISGIAYTTSYAYNATDALTGVVDSMANVRSFTYDGRNLRLTAQDLHASTDTTFGTWTFTYDTSGNLSTSVSPNAITTTYTYDALNRTLTEDASSTTGIDVTYGYDSCTNGTGLLCTTSVNGGASTTNVYTANNRVSSETKTISSVAYATTTTYDYAGNPLTITHPDSTIVRNTYNAIGALATVEKKTSLDASYAMVASTFTYGPDNQLTSQTNANGTITTNTYDNTKRYRLTRKVTTGLATSSSFTSAPTTVTFYPSAGDGYTYKNNASWDTAHDATTGAGALGTSTTATSGTGKSTTNYYLYRAPLPFDTSSLPDDATITSATLKAYVTSTKNNDNDGDDFLTVVQSTQTSTATLTTSDYGRTGATNNPTEGIDATGRKDITSISANAWLTFTLNTTGQGFISKTSSSKFALREGHDAIDSSFTSTSTTATQYNTVAFRTSEYTGTTYDPVLSVTYTTSSASATTATNFQDLSYLYDAVGNILTIVDASNETTAKTTTYIYDDLSRLTSEAVTGSANGDNTTITYAYNALGNITFRSDKGTYTYAGNTGSSYANPHAVTSILKTDGTTQTFTYDNNGNLTSDGMTTYTWDYKNRLTGSAAASSSSSTTTTTATFAPTVGDGFVYNGSSSTWATNHDATSGSYADAITTQVMAQVGKDSSGATPYNIVRALFPFDTSSIPSTATITAASLSVYVYGKDDQIVDAYDYATVVQSTQTSTTTVANGDYSKVGTATSPTEGIATTERKDLATVSVGAYLTFTLNATGQGFITKAGVTKLGVREGHDTANISTGVTAGRYNYLNMYSGEQTGTTQDPYLSVTYTTPSSSSSTTTNPVTYSYDAFDARVTKSATVTSTGVVTTSIYPSSGYSVDGSTTTVYIAGPSSSSLASILNTNTTSSVLSAIHSDHLGSTAVLSDTSGIMTELLDYHGYGNSRLTSGTVTAKKTFIGQYSDTETNLSYLNARYYDSARGQFLSEDSVFLGMGTDGKMLNQLLTDPQLQNSYSYARDNPITLKDADGKFAFSDLAGYALHPVHSFNHYVAIPAAMAVLDYLRTPPTLESLDSAIMGSFVPGGKAVQLAKPVAGAMKSIGKAEIQKGGYTVYQSIKNGVVEYVGITTNFARREAEHLANGRRIEQINGLSNITRNAARGAEQLLIDHYGLGKNGGVLSNIINSISRLNPNYQKYIDSGKQALDHAGISVKL